MVSSFVIEEVVLYDQIIEGSRINVLMKLLTSCSF